ncbi:hypothetical protein FPQ18DRAFT_158170 [Pyronema domesticum]|nr:hypothetical protein FPQ18DRAFT_158170 [Pyronema domesticum]
MRIDSLLNDSPSGSLSPTNIPQRSYSTSDGYSQQYPTHLDPAFTYQHQHQYRRPSLQTPLSHHHHGNSASAGVSFEHVQSTPQFTSPIWYAPTGTTKPSQTQRQMLPALSNITNHQQSSSYQSHHSHSQQNSPRSGARNEHVFNEYHYGGSYQRRSFDGTTDRLMDFAHVATQIDSRSRDTRGSVGIIDPLLRQAPPPATPAINTEYTHLAQSRSASPATDSAVEFLSQEPRCSYCTTCTTGSPLRKVVSHIFGRNKLSTRQIPKNVWVYYCRKHYQRSRYRNPKGFARQQVSLVRRQCDRLEKWGGVKQWVIKVRRREEMRMSREGGDEGEDLSDGDEEEGEGPDGTRRRRSSTGSQNWIMKHTGSDRTIQDVYELLDKIDIEVQNNGGKFPDVELLPYVDLALAVGGGEDGSMEQTMDQEMNVSPGGRKRRASTREHSITSKKPRAEMPRSYSTLQTATEDSYHSHAPITPDASHYGYYQEHDMRQSQSPITPSVSGESRRSSASSWRVGEYITSPVINRAMGFGGYSYTERGQVV